MKVAIIVLLAVLSVAFGEQCTARWYCGPSRCFDNGMCTKDLRCRNQCFCNGKFADASECEEIEDTPQDEQRTTLISEPELAMEQAEEKSQECSARWYCGPSRCFDNGMCTKDLRCRNQCFCDGKFAPNDKCPGIENMPNKGFANKVSNFVTNLLHTPTEEQCYAKWFCGPSSCNADRTMCTKDIRCRNQCFCGKSFAQPERCPGIEDMPQGGRGNILVDEPVLALERPAEEVLQPVFATQECSARWFCGPSSCNADRTICTRDIRCRNQCFCGKSFAKPEMCPGIENMPQGGRGNILVNEPVLVMQRPAEEVMEILEPVQPMQPEQCHAEWFCGPSACGPSGICTMDIRCRNQCFCNGHFAPNDKCPGIENMPQGDHGFGGFQPIQRVGNMLARFLAKKF